MAWIRICPVCRRNIEAERATRQIGAGRRQKEPLSCPRFKGAEMIKEKELDMRYNALEPDNMPAAKSIISTLQEVYSHIRGED